MAPEEHEATSVTRTYRAAIRFGENHITLEETITLGLDANQEDIEQAVALGWRIYEAQHAALEKQVEDLRELWGMPAPGPITIRNPDEPASEKQRRLIASLQHDLGWNSDRLASYANEQGVDLVSMTKGQASAFIDELKRLSEERPLAGQVAPSVFQAAEPGEGSGAAGAAGPVTERQRQALARLAQGRNVNLTVEVHQRFGVEVSDLTSQQASELITEWQRK